MLDQANAALKGGDFAKYGELQKQLRKALQTLPLSHNRSHDGGNRWVGLDRRRLALPCVSREGRFWATIRTQLRLRSPLTEAASTCSLSWTRCARPMLCLSPCHQARRRSVEGGQRSQGGRNDLHRLHKRQGGGREWAVKVDEPNFVIGHRWQAMSVQGGIRFGVAVSRLKVDFVSSEEHVLRASRKWMS